ncbi:MAG: hypothetical protein AAGJ52_01190 [Pseudomonadota bacterium]
MNAIATRKAVTLFLSLLSITLAVFLWEQQPQGVLIWLAGALTIPVFWVGLFVSGALHPERAELKRLKLYNALAKASVPICLALASVAMGVVGWSHEDGLVAVGQWLAGL